MNVVGHRAARLPANRVILSLWIAVTSLFAFPCVAKADSQSALRDYDFVVSILRTDYAGFPSKTEGAKAEEFARLERERRAAIDKDPDSAPAEIRALLRWCGDRHLGLSGPSPGTSMPSPDPSAFSEEGSRPTISEPDPHAVARRDRLIPSDEFFLRRLSPKTLWLRLPDFAAEHQAEIEALLAQHDGELRSTPNLIVDLRNNSGGADSGYGKLMTYLYTRPIYSIGAETRNTERNISYFSDAADSPDLPPDTRTFLGELLERLRSSDAEWVPLFRRGFSITTYPERMPFPKRVGIIGTGAGSSGEQFIIDARFSHKVTLFGGSTAGVIDFSNVNEAHLPSNGDFVLRWPVTRSQRLPEEPLDDVGVPPDVPLGRGVEDPVGATQAWLESNPG